MVLEIAGLTGREVSHVVLTIGWYAHAREGFLVGDRGDQQSTAVFERNEAAIE
jgi:hypothetical protein